MKIDEITEIYIWAEAYKFLKIYKKKNLKNISLLINDDTLKQINAIAKNLKVDKSAVISGMLKRQMEKK